MKWLGFLLFSLLELISADFAVNTTAFHEVLHHVHGPLYNSADSEITGHDLEEIYTELFVKADCLNRAANCTAVSTFAGNTFIHHLYLSL